MDDDSKNSNYVYEAWERLLEDTDETVRKKNLILGLNNFYFILEIIFNYRLNLNPSLGDN